MSRSTGRRIGSRNRDSVELRVTCCGQRLALIGLPLTPPDAPVWFDPEPRGQLVEHDNDDATTLNVAALPSVSAPRSVTVKVSDTLPASVPSPTSDFL